MATTSGEKIETRVEYLDPSTLKLLELNARFMRHEVFQQLVQNIKRDGALTQIPFACREDDGKYLVLSGNHRVKAAIQAGLKEIPVQLTDDEVTQQKRLAIQLSHNALTGEDDPATLKLLYEQMDDLDLRTYSGLDDKLLEMLKSIDPPPLKEEMLEFSTINLVFLPDDLEKAKQAFDVVKATLSGDEAWVAKWREYDRTLDAIDVSQRTKGISNQATALSMVLSIFENNQHQITADLLDDDRVRRRVQEAWVPISSLIGNDEVPEAAAEVIKSALNKMLANGDLETTSLWRAFELWAADYLAGEGDGQKASDE
jgi:hypothetical protein